MSVLSLQNLPARAGGAQLAVMSLTSSTSDCCKEIPREPEFF